MRGNVLRVRDYLQDNVDTGVDTRSEAVSFVRAFEGLSASERFYLERSVAKIPRPRQDGVDPGWGRIISG